jgi:hypothetical protein
MKYQIGSPGRIIMVRFEDREDVLDRLITIAKKENVRAAVFSLLGGMREGRFVVGPLFGGNSVKAMKSSERGQSSGRKMSRRSISMVSSVREIPSRSGVSGKSQRHFLSSKQS